MDILHVIIVFPPVKEKGGPLRSVHNLAKAQVNQGHDVTVYTTDMKAQNERFNQSELRTTMDGISIRRYRNLSHRLAWNDVPIPLGMAKGLDKHIDEFDVVHAHACRTLDAVFVHHYAKKHNVPYVMQPRGSLPRMSKKYKKFVFDKLFGKRIFEQADLLVASSRVESSQFRDVFAGIWEEQVTHVPNGIDLETYTKDIEPGQFRRKFGFDESTNLILFLSRLHERKGADLLLDAFDSIQQRRDDVALVIAGPDDGYLDNLQRMVDRRDIEDVYFPGGIYGDSKLGAYSDADIFVLPSKDKYESFGNVVVEAMARKTAVIMTRCCGVSEWIDDEAGITVEPSAASIEEALELLLQDEEYRESLSSQGRNHVSEFAWENIAQKMQPKYEGIVR